MKKKFNTIKVITISAGHFFHDLYTAFLAPLLPLLIEKLSLSLSQAGFLEVIRRIPSLFNPLIGIVADKWSIKYFVILTPAITAISMSLLGVAPNYAVLTILLFITGISSAFFHVPAPVVIKKISGKKTGTGMSFYMFGGEIARTLGPVVITAAVSFWSLEGAYRVMPVGIIASLLLFFKLRDIDSLNGMEKIKKFERKKRVILKKLLPLFSSISGFQLFRTGVKTALTLYLPVYLTGKGESLWFAGISLSVVQLAGAAGTIGIGYFSDKISRRTILIITSILTPVLMWGFIFANSFWIFPILILTGIVLFIPGPVILAVVQDTNTEKPAFVNSIYMTLNFTISSLMVLLIGFMGDNLKLDLTFKIMSFAAFLSIPFVFFLPRKN